MEETYHDMTIYATKVIDVSTPAPGLEEHFTGFSS